MQIARLISLFVIVVAIIAVTKGYRRDEVQSAVISVYRDPESRYVGKTGIAVTGPAVAGSGATHVAQAWDTEQVLSVYLAVTGSHSANIRASLFSVDAGEQQLWIDGDVPIRIASDEFTILGRDGPVNGTDLMPGAHLLKIVKPKE